MRHAWTLKMGFSFHFLKESKFHIPYFVAAVYGMYLQSYVVDMIVSQPWTIDGQ